MTNELEIIKGALNAAIKADREWGWIAECKLALAAVERLEAEMKQIEVDRNLEEDGHGQKCYYCGSPCNSLAANPSCWPVLLCHSDDPGVPKPHHVGCVSERLERAARLRAERQSDTARLDWMQKTYPKYPGEVRDVLGNDIRGRIDAAIESTKESANG